MRLIALFLGLAVLVLVPFAIWGDRFENAFNGEAARLWLESLGPWAWAAGIGLLIGDLVLPVPSTPIISALGWVYGMWLGGCLGATGSFLSGSLAYGLCRRIGDKAALKILGEKDFSRGRKLFASAGGWIIALSRWLPVLPEITCCMAGLAKMAPRRFFLALACGSLPMGFAYAWIGAQTTAHPSLALALSAALPVLLWAVATRIMHNGEKESEK